MTGKPSKQRKAKEAEPVELEPDAWARFEHAVDVVVKSPPKHRAAKPTGKARKSPAKPARGGGSGKPRRTG